MKNTFENMHLLGLDEKVSSKGNKYTVGLFQQGTGVETCQFMLPAGQYQIGQTYSLKCDYSFRWKSYKVISVIPNK